MTLIALAAGLLATAGQRAGAVSIETRLMPRSLNYQDRDFQINTKDVDGLKEIEVTILAKSGKLSPFLSADLTINTGEAHLAVVRLQGTRSDGKVTYWFRLSPQTLANSRFQFMEAYYQTTKDARGKPQFEQIIGGAYYWFHPSDFVRPPDR